MTSSDDIDEHGLVLHEETIREKENEERGQNRPAIKEKAWKSIEQEKVADHLDVISDRIEMQVNAQIGRRVID